MKKIIAVIAACVIAFTMISCTKKYSFSLSVDSVGELRTSLVFDYTLKDDEKELSKSTVKADLSNKGSSSVLASKTLSFSSENKTGSVSFTGLDPDKEYSVRIYVGYNGKSVNLYSKTVKTTTNGTIDNPYEISEASQFTTLVKNDPSGYFVLTSDIDFAGSSIGPMFTTTSVSTTSSSAFSGHFNGQGHTIRNFKYGKEGGALTLSTSYYGFFGCIAAGGVVENVTLDSFDVFVSKSAKGYFGLLAGYNAGEVKSVNITNSNLNVISTGASVDSVVGGLVAHNALEGTISDANISANVNVNCKRTTSVGGIVGFNQNTTDKNLISNVTYNGKIDVNVENTSTSTYSATICVGGIIGYNDATIKNATADAEIVLKSSFEKPSTTTYDIYVGGIAGHNRSDKAHLVSCNATASFDVTSYDALVVKVGGISGQNGAAKTPIYASIKDSTYSPKADVSNKINIFEDVKLELGLVAVDKAKAEKSYHSSNEFSFLVTYFHEVKQSTGTDDDKKETIVIEKLKEEKISFDINGTRL